MLSLTECDVHLWCLDLDLQPGLLTSLREEHVSWLSERERQRFSRLQLPERRRHYLLGKVFVRQVLSRYCETAPAAWRFSENAHGKPFIVYSGAEESVTELHFNLSHSRQRFVLAVSRVPATGVDVEHSARRRRVSRLVQRYFCADECAWLLGLPAQQQQSAFYWLWTLKEAYMKACGLGQALGLDTFGFDLSKPGMIQFRPAAGELPIPGRDTYRWRCWSLADPLTAARGKDDYAMALMLGRDAGSGAADDMSLAAYRYGPGEDIESLPVTILASN